MSTHILNNFNKFPITINTKLCDAINIFITSWELRGNNPLALNTQTLGVYNAYLYTTDIDMLFDIVNIDKKLFSSTIKSLPPNIIHGIVTGDSFNLVIIWTIYNILNSTIGGILKLETSTNLLKLLHYKFFTSAVSHYLKYTTDEDTMLITISKLSNQYDIIIYETWKNVFAVSSKEFMTKGSIHFKTLETFNDDEKITYIISDISTRTRARLKNFLDVFYQVKDDKSIDLVSRKMTGNDLSGDKIIFQQIDTFSIMIESISNKIITPSSFIDNNLINSLTSIYPSVSSNIFKNFITYMSITSSLQLRKNDFDKVSIIKKNTIFVGVRELIKMIIQRTYKYCISSGINVNKASEIYLTTRNIYKASRTSNIELLEIKESVAYHINASNVTKRDATIASLRLMFILYVVILSFDHLK